ncbi:MAG: CHAT domain-containing protein [Calditrichia bacterium]
MIRSTLLLLLSAVLFSSTICQADEAAADTAKAWSLFKQAKALASASKMDSSNMLYFEARDLFKQAAEKGLTEAWSPYMQCKIFVGGNLQMVQKLDSSEQVLLESIEEAIPLLGEDHIQLGTAYNNIGSLYQDWADYATSFEYLNKALAIRRKAYGENHVDVAAVMNNIGVSYGDMDDFTNALVYFEKALEIRINALPETHPHIMASYNNLGIVSYNRGDYNRALDYYGKTLELIKINFGDKHPYVGYINNNFANTYREMGEFKKAISHFKIALDVYGNSASGSSGHYNLGIVYYDMAKYDTAKVYFTEALKRYSDTYGEDHPYVSYAQLSLGAIAYHQSDYDSATHYFELAKSMRDELYGSVHELIAEGFEKYGEMYEHQGKLDEALVEYQKALGALSYSFDDMDLAKNPGEEETISEQKVLENMTQKATLLRKRYKETQNLPDLRLSLATYERIGGFVESLRSGFKAEGSKLFLGKQSATTFDGALQTALELAQVTNDDSFTEKAFLFAEKNKSGTLLEALSDVEAKRFANIPDTLLEKERTIRFELAALNQRVLQSQEKGAKVDSLRLPGWKDRLFKLKLDLDKLTARLEKEYPQYYNLKYQTNDVKVSDVRKHLVGKKDALIEYMLGDSTIYAFVITRKNVEAFQLKKPADLDKQVKLMRSGLVRDDINLYARYANRLYTTLLKPLQPLLKKKKHLQIIPDGILGYLPFEALLTQPAKRNAEFTSLDYLIHEVTIGYGYSARLMIETQQRRQEKTSGYLAFAPGFEDESDTLQSKNNFLAAVRSLDSSAVFRGDGKVIPLPATREETSAVANIFKRKKKRSTLLLNKQANEDKIKAADISSYRYLHFATHGFVNEKQPQLSGLLLAADSSSEEDAVLYSSEVYNLNLNAELVVLSACETGLGKLVRGEGIIGLTRGFLYAGAKNLTVSLWQVSDQSTAILMTNFFERVAKGKKLSDSLRRAKQKLIEDEQYASPFYWSPFILIGK